MKIQYATIVLAVSGASLTLGEPIFQSLEEPREASSEWPGRNPNLTQARSISSNGDVVVGHQVAEWWSAPANWTASTGWTKLDQPENELGLRGGTAHAVTPHGTISVGRWEAADGMRAVRWGASGMQLLDELPNQIGQSAAFDVSENGTVAVGYCETDQGPEAVMWMADGSVRRLGKLEGDTLLSKATIVSEDGRTVIGSMKDSKWEGIFTWTQQSGMTKLDGVTGIPVAGNSHADIVVGFTRSDSGVEAFRWSEFDGVRMLGDLPGGNYSSTALGVTEDGNTVIGSSDTIIHHDGQDFSGFEAFIWTDCGGMRRLADLLTEDYGVDLTGWTLLTANAITPDGSRIVGDGINPDGKHEPFLVTLPTTRLQDEYFAHSYGPHESMGTGDFDSCSIAGTP